jgi:hypothetical protein
MFGFRPSHKLYDDAMALASTPNLDNWGQSEQQVIRNYLQRPDVTRHVVWLGPIYNQMALNCDCMPKWGWDTIRIVHYFCSEHNGRPWRRYDPDAPYIPVMIIRP